MSQENTAKDQIKQIDNEENQLNKVKDLYTMYKSLVTSYRLTLDNFLLLYLKKNEDQLSEEIKKERDTAEKVILSTSLAGKGFSLFYMVTRLSFLNSLPFNPLRDLQVFVISYFALVLADSIPISLYWPKFEPYIMKFNPTGENRADLFANSTMSPIKLYYYKKWI